MKNIPLQLAIFCTGFLACLFLTQKKCVQVPVDRQFIHDTVFVKSLDFVYDYRDTVYIKKPIYKTRYVPKTDTLVVFMEPDTSYELFKLIPDTVWADSEVIPINEYEDSAVGVDYKLKWNASVYGYILTMDAKVQTYQPIPEGPTSVERPKNWQAGLGLGIGQKGGLYPKASFGYKGWMVEPVFTSEFKYDRIYLTKLVRF